MGTDMAGMGWAGMGFGVVPMIGFWVLLIVAVVAGTVLLFRWFGGLRGANAQPPHGDTALDLLKKRYARGEISREEFGQTKRDLES